MAKIHNYILQDSLWKFLQDINIEVVRNTMSKIPKNFESGTSLKRHNALDLSIKDEFCGPHRTTAIQLTS